MSRLSLVRFALRYELADEITFRLYADTVASFLFPLITAEDQRRRPRYRRGEDS